MFVLYYLMNENSGLKNVSLTIFDTKIGIFYYLLKFYKY